MLRLLARTVHLLWRNQPPDAYSIHIHHMDPGFEPIRTEIHEKIGMRQYAAAIKADVAAVPGDEPALAQRLDAQKFPGLPPATSYVARTIFWHTLAFGDAARGVSPNSSAWRSARRRSNRPSSSRPAAPSRRRRFIWMTGRARRCASWPRPT